MAFKTNKHMKPCPLVLFYLTSPLLRFLPKVWATWKLFAAPSIRWSMPSCRPSLVLQQIVLIMPVCSLWCLLKVWRLVSSFSGAGWACDRFLMGGGEKEFGAPEFWVFWNQYRATFIHTGLKIDRHPLWWWIPWCWRVWNVLQLPKTS